MPRIVLMQAFIHHYAGSVFELAEATSYSNWDDDDRVRDRIHLYDKKVYDLPDDGRGKNTQLPLYMTKFCPENIFKDVDIKSGPCRITYISRELEKKDDPYYNYPSLDGKGNLCLRSGNLYEKNLIYIDVKPENMPDLARITNSVFGEKYPSQFIKNNAIDFSSFLPGFYEVELWKGERSIHQFNMIKCFPLVITFDGNSGDLVLTKTVW